MPKSTMEISTSHRGESSRPNYQKPISEFTPEEHNFMINELIKKYSEETGVAACRYVVRPTLKEVNGNSYKPHMVPPLKEVNRNSYEPHMVPLVPYYLMEYYPMAEDYKRKCFGSMLGKAKNDHTRREEISTSHRGESSRSNYQKPIRAFKPEEHKFMINEQVKKYSEEAKKLEEEADLGSTRCIYRVLPRLKEVNGNSYEPHMVSIGPYYYNLRDERFKMAEDYKRKCFGSMLGKAKNDHTGLDIYSECLKRISQREEEIRKCYSEEFEVAGIEFLEMMIVDACFIIEIIDMFGPRKKVDSSESLAALGWMVPYFYRDFLLLENQIPFFVLQDIYAISRKDFGIRNLGMYTHNLTYAALEFFKNGMKRFDLDIFHFTSMNATANNLVPPSHLLDLVRSSLMPFTSTNSPFHLLDLVRSSLMPFYKQVRSSLMPFYKQQGPEFPTETTFIHCVSKLRLAGIKVSPVKANSFLEVKFKEGVIEMPSIAINDLMRCLLLNCVAFEQCRKSSTNYFTVYSTFLDCLVSTSDDIEYLRERNVIDNYLADDSEAADFVNRAGKDLVLNADNGFYLGKLFRDVDKHYQNRWNWKWASFKREYFDKPWLLLSAAGGILLVAATLFQAVMAYLSYKYKNC